MLNVESLEDIVIRLAFFHLQKILCSTFAKVFVFFISTLGFWTCIGGLDVYEFLLTGFILLSTSGGRDIVGRPLSLCMVSPRWWLCHLFDVLWM